MLEKFFSSKTTETISVKLDANYPCLKGFKFTQIEGHVIIKGEIIKKCKRGVGSFKDLFLKITGSEKLRFTSKLADSVN
jgi:hypothetical protein